MGLVVLADTRCWRRAFRIVIFPDPAGLCRIRRNRRRRGNASTYAQLHCLLTSRSAPAKALLTSRAIRPAAPPASGCLIASRSELNQPRCVMGRWARSSGSSSCPEAANGVQFYPCSHGGVAGAAGCSDGRWGHEGQNPAIQRHERKRVASVRPAQGLHARRKGCRASTLRYLGLPR